MEWGSLWGHFCGVAKMEINSPPKKNIYIYIYINFIYSLNHLLELIINLVIWNFSNLKSIANLEHLFHEIICRSWNHIFQVKIWWKFGNTKIIINIFIMESCLFVCHVSQTMKPPTIILVLWETTSLTIKVHLLDKFEINNFK